MKPAILILILCAFAFPSDGADEPEFSKSKVEALIASLPTRAETEKWRAYYATPEAGRDPVDAALDAKMKDEFERFQQLLAQLKPGKSIFDYPGLLALGVTGWDAETKTYTFYVTHIGSVDYPGFTCTFSESGVIVKKELLMSAGK